MSGPMWPVYSSQNMPMSVDEKKSNDTLGKDEFLKILLTQLQNQDPSQPLQDREFIAQMAQFSSVEQLMNMSNEIGALRQSLGISSDLIGKEVSWLDADTDGESIIEVYGVVDAILFDNGMQFAKVGDMAIPIDDIVRVTEPGQSDPTDPGEEDGESPPEDEVPEQEGDSPNTGETP